MRGETPDLDLTAGQPPQSMDRVAPFRTPKAGVPEILHQVQDVIERYKLEPDRVESLGKGRVLILTQDGDLKRELIRVLEKNGKKVDASRKGALIVRPYPRRVQGVTTMGVTTVPIAEDEDLMLLTRRKRERDLADQEREESRTGKKRKAQNYTPPNVTVAPSPTPAYQQQFQGQQQQGGPQQADPQTSVIIPSSQEQIQLLKDKYGANLTTTNMPGGETKINFANPAQMQKYTNDQKKITLQGPSSSRRARQEMVRTARELGQSLNDDDYETAHLHLNNLRDLGVKEETIIRSSLAGRQTWANFSRYLESRGEIENSRVARRASRFAGSL
jgi:ribosomal protein S18